MKTYSQYIKENQQYLTEPYDPEFVITIVLKEQIESILKKLRELGENRLGLSVRTVDQLIAKTRHDIYHIIYEGDIKLPSGGIMEKKCILKLKYTGFGKKISLFDSNDDKIFNTLEDVENYLKTYFNR